MITYEFLMSLMDNKENFEKLSMMTNNIIPFVGAGLSKPYFPLWKEFLCGFAEKHGEGYRKKVNEHLDKNEYELAAAYLMEEFGTQVFDDQVISKYAWHDDKDKVSETCGLLPYIFHGPVVTTNFDKMLEELEKRAPEIPDYQKEYIAKCANEAISILKQ
jgi:hypothetical protein